MPFIGVRSSWLMLATNCDFSRVGLERLIAGRGQFGVGALALGDVARHRLEAASCRCSSDSICTFCPIQTVSAVAADGRELEIGVVDAVVELLPIEVRDLRSRLGATSSRKWQPISADCSTLHDPRGHRVDEREATARDRRDR